MKKYRLTIANKRYYNYNKAKTNKEVDKVSAMIAERIRRLNLTEEQKKNLQIKDKDLEKCIDGDFVQKVVGVIDKYKNVIKELAKY